MRLHLDTADRAAAEDLLATGLFAGLTTTPTILRRASLGVEDIGDIYRWALDAALAGCSSRPGARTPRRW
jgi:transaldolase